MCASFKQNFTVEDYLYIIEVLTDILHFSELPIIYYELRREATKILSAVKDIVNNALGVNLGMNFSMSVIM